MKAAAAINFHILSCDFRTSGSESSNLGWEGVEWQSDWHAVPKCMSALAKTDEGANERVLPFAGDWKIPSQEPI